jgi:hypothetical protein
MRLHIPHPTPEPQTARNCILYNSTTPHYKDMPVASWSILQAGQSCKLVNPANSCKLLQKAEEEAAKVYEEFVESFAADEAEDGRGVKAFVRGGTVMPGSSAHDGAGEARSGFWCASSCSSITSARQQQQQQQWQCGCVALQGGAADAAAWACNPRGPKSRRSSGIGAVIGDEQQGCLSTHQSDGVC